MKKLFLILLLITIASINSHATIDNNPKCLSIFAPKNASAHINDIVAPFEVKKLLLQQTLHSKPLREFVVEYSTLIDKLYWSRFSEAAQGKFIVDYSSLGFKSSDEARALKEIVLSKQIKILSIMDPNDMTIEFANDFKRIATRVYDVTTTKQDILSLNDRMDKVILNYSKI